MGDVVSIGTGKVVQTDETSLPQRSLSEPGIPDGVPGIGVSDSDLFLDADQVGDFIALVNDLDINGDTRSNQFDTMNRIRAAVRAWPDG